jgi:transglutaminase-like putative cysteine protease
VRLISGIVFLLWAGLVVLAPVLGVWLASSLIAFHAGPTWVAICGGALLFPALPLLWEWRASVAFKLRSSRRQFGVPPRRKLTFSARVIFRTLALNVAFLAALAVGFPEQAFPALATRGDWFIDGKAGPGAERMRGDLHAAASGLEWLYELAHENPYKHKGDDAPVPDSVKPVVESTFMPAPTARRWIPGTAAWTRSPAPVPEPTGASKPPPEPEPVELAQRPKPPLPEPIAIDKTPPFQPPQPKPPQPVAVHASDELADATYTVGDTQWPWKDRPAAVLSQMTPQDELSIDAVARFIAARESDDFHRVKALHDWVVTRLRYDKATAAIHTRNGRAPQDAASVFAARTGVCEGYARLMVAFGQVTGDRIVYLTGDVREKTGEAAPTGHAWNAVELRGRWYLVDTTWDDPTMNDGSDAYRTDYLFIPPSLAIFDHFPDEPRWQLLATPLGRGDFLRQPLARPTLAKEGLTLVNPERSTVEVDGPLVLELLNPNRRWLLGTVVPEGGGSKGECGVTNDSKPRLTCQVPVGVSHVELFSNTQRNGTYGDVAEFLVYRR